MHQMINIAVLNTIKSVNILHCTQVIAGLACNPLHSWIATSTCHDLREAQIWIRQVILIAILIPELTHVLNAKPRLPPKLFLCKVSWSIGWGYIAWSAVRQFIGDLLSRGLFKCIYHFQDRVTCNILIIISCKICRFVENGCYVLIYLFVLTNLFLFLDCKFALPQNFVLA